MDATHKRADCTASFWDAEDLSRHRKDAHEDCGAQSWASAKGVRDIPVGEDDITQSGWAWGDSQMLAAAASTDVPDIRLPDHHAAAVATLRKLADRIEQGTSPEDVGPDVVLLGRIMARRT